jgi:hypothetical protein
MKKLLITALIGTSTFAVSAPATAAHVGENFETRGQCEARIAESRNMRRKASQMNAGEFNKSDVKRYYCEEEADGSFTIEESDER